MDAKRLPVSEAIGDRIRRRRIDLGVSQAELAARVGLSFQQIQKYERGTNRISTETLLDVARALSCPATVLLGISDTLPPEQAWLLSVAGDEETSLLMKRFSEIKSMRVRKRVLAIIDTLLSEDGIEKELGERQRAPKATVRKLPSRAKAKKTRATL